MGKKNIDKDDKDRKGGPFAGFHINDIQPKTDNQSKAFDSYYSGKHLCLHGVAGTGKSFISLYLALHDVLRGYYNRILIVRSIVSSRDIGFLPGNLTEKISVYENPYRDMFAELFNRGDAYDNLKKKNAVEFVTTSFIRGLTFNNCVIVLDEVQNMTWNEIFSVLSRVGENSRVIICGDFNQNDLMTNYRKNNESGMESMMKVLTKMNSFDMIPFGISDIVRSDFVKSLIIASLDLNNRY